MGHRVLVCGGRRYYDRDRLFSVLDYYQSQQAFDVVIHGNATGADLLAGQWATARGVPVQAYPAEWDLYGRAAGHIRNAQMIAEGKPTIVVAFPGGPGTTNMKRQAREVRIPVLEIDP